MLAFVLDCWFVQPNVEQKYLYKTEQTSISQKGAHSSKQLKEKSVDVSLYTQMEAFLSGASYCKFNFGSVYMPIYSFVYFLQNFMVLKVLTVVKLELSFSFKTMNQLLL